MVQYVIAFIEELDAAKSGNVKDRIVAVMGGSLGGNTSLLLTDRYDPTTRPYLRTIVSWSVTATAPARYAGLVPGAWRRRRARPPGEGGVQPGIARRPRDRGDVHREHVHGPARQGALFTVLPLPPQPIMWYRGGYVAGDGLDWQPCKDASIAQSRFDRYEIYSAGDPSLDHRSGSGADHVQLPGQATRCSQPPTPG